MPERFHARFLDALAGDARAISAWCVGPGVEAGLSVYRNTIAKGRSDALSAMFPTVEQVVGPDWLAAAARLHADEVPPRRASLLTYGEDFPAWLADFPPAADMPFLAGLARLDVLWTVAHLAADAAPLDPARMAALRPEDFARSTLALHPATRFAGFDESLPSLWRALQPAGPPPARFELELRPEGLLIVRPGLEIETLVVGPGALAFLSACAEGASLADAAVGALTAEAGLDLSRLFATLVAAGAFQSLRTLP
jgi:hypothetical protein